MRPLHGVIASLVTPFTASQQVDLDALARLVRFLLNAGIHGFYITGSAGEWVRLTTEERKAIAEVVLRETAGRVPVVVHVGHFSTAVALDLCRHACASGADYVSSVVPGYYRYTVAELVAYYRAIAAVGPPVILYCLESSGNALSARTFVKDFGSIENLAGMKYTATDLFPMQNVYHLSEGRLQVWSGHDQMALAGLMMSAAGVIGTNYNYLPELYIELYQAFRTGNLQRAAEIQAEANQILEAVKQFGDLRAYKLMLALRGLPVGDCRLPTSCLSTDEVEGLKRVAASFAHRLRTIDAG